MWTETEDNACQKLIDLALAEDLSTQGDVTSRAVIPAEWNGKAFFVARADGVLAGMPAVARVLKAIDASLCLDILMSEGTAIRTGDRLARAHGPLVSMLSAERTALNFLQHLSGVASLTRRYAEEVAGTRAQVLDTRKTLPGWRVLDKYAVRVGGGQNHRMGLFDAALIKDNHLAAIADQKRSLLDAVQSLRKMGGASCRFVEIEVDRVDQLDDVFGLRPDYVLLDNMSLDQMRAAVRLRDEKAPAVLLEASGGVNLRTIRGIAETGVDRISVGALTHSAAALDIALDYDS